LVVDHPISYRPANQGRAKISYPDVAIVRDSSLLVGIIELKVDLGYTKREWVAESIEGRPGSLPVGMLLREVLVLGVEQGSERYLAWIDQVCSV